MKVKTIDTLYKKKPITLNTDTTWIDDKDNEVIIESIDDSQQAIFIYTDKNAYGCQMFLNLFKLKD
ncbi:MAG: hypothetical protein KAI79_12085 [Bacteroidales bacterium]|nr:hypothetical protein [Bacteroidales bacterium]